MERGSGVEERKRERERERERERGERKEESRGVHAHIIRGRSQFGASYHTTGCLCRWAHQPIHLSHRWP